MKVRQAELNHSLPAGGLRKDFRTLWPPSVSHESPAIDVGLADSPGAGPFVFELALMKKGDIMTVKVSRRNVLIGGMAVLATVLPAPAMALKLHDLDSTSDKSNSRSRNHGYP